MRIFLERGSGDGEQLIPVSIPIPARGMNSIPIPVGDKDYSPIRAGIPGPTAIPTSMSLIFAKRSLASYYFPFLSLPSLNFLLCSYNHTYHM